MLEDEFIDQRLCLGFKDAALAEDVVQDVFLAAYNSLDRLNNPGSFSTWLYSIASG
ncbi:MAG: hypothetical protein IH946_12510 [Bacteroidetes bacterium]|nr:hypothetical protein [Bacteroidota bacterium]